MSKDRIIRKAEVMYKTGLSDTTIWRLEKAGKFPKRIKLGGNSVGWIESETDDWMDNKKAER